LAHFIAAATRAASKSTQLRLVASAAGPNLELVAGLERRRPTNWDEVDDLIAVATSATGAKAVAAPICARCPDAGHSQLRRVERDGPILDLAYIVKTLRVGDLSR
jgi:hypothetical protein